MMEHVTKVRPASVLDIGVGFGKWGFLCREYLDINELRYKPQDWKTIIDGCEAFPDYATPVYGYVYNNIFFGDVLERVSSLPNYDLIILGDVIEHFDKDVGQDLLNNLMAKSNFVLLSSPTKFFTQELFGNAFEQHKSLWTIADFSSYDFDYDEFQDFLFVVLIDCKSSGVVSKKEKISSKFAYRHCPLRSHPRLTNIVKSAVRRLI